MTDDDDRDVDNLYSIYLARFDAFVNADIERKYAAYEEARCAARQAVASYKAFKRQVEAYELGIESNDALTALRSKLMGMIGQLEARNERARAADPVNLDALEPTDAQTQSWWEKLRGKKN